MENFRNNNFGPFWHFCTDGTRQQIIFSCDEDFFAAMNVLAICLSLVNVRLVAFAIMNNHVHLILAGRIELCLEFFRLFTKRLRRYFELKGRKDILFGFECESPVAIEDARQMQTEIAYVHRNPYVARADVLPYSYRWSSGSIYFNDIVKSFRGIPFAKVPFSRRTEIFQGRVLTMPDNYCWGGDYIIPQSFVDYRLGESFFSNAAEYFIKTSKIQEDHCALLRRYNDSQVLNYEEGYSVAASLSKSRFGNLIPSTLTPQQKTELSKTLKYDYHMSNKQIASILKMDILVLNQMFPLRRHSGGGG